MAIPDLFELIAIIHLFTLGMVIMTIVVPFVGEQPGAFDDREWIKAFRFGPLGGGPEVEGINTHDHWAGKNVPCDKSVIAKLGTWIIDINLLDEIRWGKNKSKRRIHFKSHL
jgi:hypothetical protein